MTSFALALVLASAFIHATWNLLAKRAGGGAAFLWLFAVLSALLYAPIAFAIIIFQQPHLDAIALLFILGSAIIQIGYFLLLQRGYRTGDLSLVYQYFSDKHYSSSNKAGERLRGKGQRGNTSFNPSPFP